MIAPSVDYSKGDLSKVKPGISRRILSRDKTLLQRGERDRLSKGLVLEKRGKRRNGRLFAWESRRSGGSLLSGGRRTPLPHEKRSGESGVWTELLVNQLSAKKLSV